MCVAMWAARWNGQRVHPTGGCQLKEPGHGPARIVLGIFLPRCPGLPAGGPGFEVEAIDGFPVPGAHVI